MAAQPISFSRPRLPPCYEASQRGAFKLPLPPRPPVGERQAALRHSRPDNGGPPGRGWGVDCNQKRPRRRRPPNWKGGYDRRRLKVRLIPSFKVEWGYEGFIARSLLLLFAQPGVNL